MSVHFLTNDLIRSAVGGAAKPERSVRNSGVNQRHKVKLNTLHMILKSTHFYKTANNEPFAFYFSSQLLEFESQKDVQTSLDDTSKAFQR